MLHSNVFHVEVFYVVRPERADWAHGVLGGRRTGELWAVDDGADFSKSQVVGASLLENAELKRADRVDVEGEVTA
jgi:hypothetical protein